MKRKDATHVVVEYLNAKTCDSIKVAEPIRKSRMWLLVVSLLATGFAFGAIVSRL